MRNYVSKNSNFNSNTYIGTHGEITVDPNSLVVKVHDGVTPGGFRIGGDLGNLAVDNQNIYALTDSDIVIGDNTYGHGTVTLSSANNGGNVTVSTVSETWIAEYGNMPVNNSSNLFGSSVAMAADGNIYTIGGKNVPDEGIILKYDKYGLLLWQKTIDLNNATGQSITIDNSGNLWALFKNNDTNYINVYKLNTAGTVLAQWEITSTPNINYSYDIAVDASDNVFITGHTYAVDQVFSNVTPVAPSGVLGQLNANPTIFGGEIPTDDGSWVMSGTGIVGTATITTVSVGATINMTIDQNTVDFDVIGGSWTVTHHRASDIDVMKFNPTTGSLVWQFAFGDSFGDDGFSLALDGNDNVVITGYIVNPSTFRRELTVIKLDNNGNVIFKKLISSPSFYLTGQDVTIDNLGNIYVTGIKSLAGNYVLLLIKINPTNGNVVWCHTLSAPGVIVKGVSVTWSPTDGNLYLTGMFTGSNSGIIIAGVEPNGNILWKRNLSNTDPASGTYELRTYGQKAISTIGDYIAVTGYYNTNYANQFTARVPHDGTGIGKFGNWDYAISYAVYGVDNTLVSTTLPTDPVALSMTVSVTTNVSSDVSYSNIVTAFPSPNIGFVTRNIIGDIVQVNQIVGHRDLLLTSNGNILLDTGTSATVFVSDNISVEGLGTFGNLAYTMGNATHWTSTVTTVAAALDQIAARLYALENP